MSMRGLGAQCLRRALAYEPERSEGEWHGRRYYLPRRPAGVDSLRVRTICGCGQSAASDSLWAQKIPRTANESWQYAQLKRSGGVLRCFDAYRNSKGLKSSTSIMRIRGRVTWKACTSYSRSITSKPSSVSSCNWVDRNSRKHSTATLRPWARSS